MSPVDPVSVFFTWPSGPTNTKAEIISLGKPGWTSPDGQIQSKQDLTPYRRVIYVQRNKTLGTNLERKVHVMSGPNVEQDTFLDNEIGTAMHSAKAKFGKGPFIEAYKRVLSTSTKLDEEWDEYWEEEASMRSFFKEGED